MFSLKKNVIYASGIVAAIVVIAIIALAIGDISGQAVANKRQPINSGRQITQPNTALMPPQTGCTDSDESKFFNYPNPNNPKQVLRVDASMYYSGVVNTASGTFTDSCVPHSNSPAVLTEYYCTNSPQGNRVMGSRNIDCPFDCYPSPRDRCEFLGDANCPVDYCSGTVLVKFDHPGYLAPGGCTYQIRNCLNDGKICHTQMRTNVNPNASPDYPVGAWCEESRPLLAPL